MSNTHGELIGASRLASVTPGFDSDEPLVERPPQTVVQVLGLADLVVLLSLARFLTGGTELVLLVQPLLLTLPLLLQLQGPVLGQLVDGIRSLAVTEQGLLAGGEVRDLVILLSLVELLLLPLLLLLLLLDVVRADLIATRSGDVELDLGQESLLDVGDGLGLVLLDEEALDEAALQVNNEGSLEEVLEVTRELSLNDGLLLVSLLVLVDAALLREVDLTVDGQVPALLELDPEAVVREGLDSDLGGQPDAGALGVSDLGNSVQDLGLEPVGELLVRVPAVVVGRVAPGNAD